MNEAKLASSCSVNGVNVDKQGLVRGIRLKLKLSSSRFLANADT